MEEEPRTAAPEEALEADPEAAPEDAHEDAHEDANEDAHEDEDNAEGAAEASTTTPNESHTVYMQSGYCKKMLFLLSLGVKQSDSSDAPLFDPDVYPWTKLARRLIKPKMPEIAAEIIRRSTNLHQAPPKFKTWPRSRALDWVREHPITDPADVAFLRHEVGRVAGVLGNRGGQPPAKRWTLLPHLRMILCIVNDEEIRELLLDRQDPSERIAQKWNDATFNPVAPASQCHGDFVAPKDCSHYRMLEFATATREKVGDMLSQHSQQLFNIIRNWERHGQGNANPEPEIGPSSERFGVLSQRSAHALNSRASFLTNYPSYFLYLWEMADKYQMLPLILPREPQAGAAQTGGGDDGSVGSVVSQALFDATQHAGAADAINHLAQSQRAMAESQTSETQSQMKRQRLRECHEDRRQVRQRLAALEDTRRQLRIDSIRSRNDSGLVSVLRDEITKIDETTELLRQELTRLDSAVAHAASR